MTTTPAATDLHGPLGDLGPLVLGGNVFGWTADQEASFDVLDAFVDAGGRAIDTADAYSVWAPGHAGGESETIIGDWLAARGNRADVSIATKVGKHPELTGLARQTVRDGLAASLGRLGTDYVDLYYAHADDDSQTPEEIAETFAELVAEGSVRAIGLSNFTPDRLRAVVEAGRAAGGAVAAYSQDRYNLVERGLEADLGPVLTELGVVELPYHALAAGFLTGKYRTGAEIDSPRAGGAAKYLERPGAGALLDLLDDVARRRSVPVSAVAIAWLRARPTVGAPIASARSAAQLEGLVASFDLVLDEADARALDDASAAQA